MILYTLFFFISSHMLVLDKQGRGGSTTKPSHQHPKKKKTNPKKNTPHRDGFSPKLPQQESAKW